MKILSLLSMILLAVLSPLACSKTFTLAPPPAPTPTITPMLTATSAATPICNDPCLLTAVNCVGGIMWGEAQVWNLNNNSAYQYGALLALAVNCSPETTDGVTLTGPGVTLPLTYASPETINGTYYSLYQSVTVMGSLTTGASYTLTTVTSLGTANSSLILPESPSMTTGTGVTFTWNGFDNGCLYLFKDNGGGALYTTGCGFYAASPEIYPSPCGNPCDNGAELMNATFGITGGSGYYEISNGVMQTGP